MKKFTIVIAIILIFNITSCSSNEKQGSVGGIKIYYMDNDINIKNAVREYNEKNKDLISETLFYSDQKQKFTETLQYELTTGEGPDIIVFEPDMLPELSKYMGKGIFFNIDEVMTKDKGFKIDDYNNQVLKFGVYNKCRYVVPLYYSIKAFFTTGELLKKCEINSETSFLDMNDMAEIASGYIKQNGNHFFSPLDFSYFMNGDNDFVDVEKKKAKFNTDEFTKLLGI